MSVKNLPSDTRHGALYKTPNDGDYVITDVEGKDKRILWKCVPGGYEKVKEHKDMDELKKLIPWPTPLT